jgi:hypothetical protein
MIAHEACGFSAKTIGTMPGTNLADADSDNENHRGQPENLPPTVIVGSACW